ncbi:MAG: DUF1844 domain-containing protein [Pedosphaera sp.]|nr:DUF1844 domain-containing protein [Pedosphaera sp.]MST00594.1 DUF1844 domain-containing protein [Pedosphaera sp.]
MNNVGLPEDSLANASREEIHSALFLNLVMQQASTAMMLLGKMPHPETGERLMDPETAKLVIDQLEMIEAKTKGNLDAQEQKILKQALSALHMAFVEALEGNAEPTAPPAPSFIAPQAEPAKTAPVLTSAPAPAPVAATASKPDEEESRKKFVKKY